MREEEGSGARSAWARIRRRTWQIVEVAGPGDRPSWWFDVGIRLLIALNVAAVILETLPDLSPGMREAFRWFEAVSIAAFTVEYLARVWSAVEDSRYGGAVRGRLRFAVTPMALVDLLAVLPALLPLAGADLRILRGARLFRLVRILKMGRYSRALRTVGRVFRRRRPQLVIAISALAFLLLVASALMYFAEHGTQPDKFSSIPAAMWWGVVTLTTLGYGDVYPVTALGRVMGGLFALTGLLMVALPTAILGAGFVAEMTEAEAEDVGPGRCPRCGYPLGERGQGRAGDSEDGGDTKFP